MAVAIRLIVGLGNPGRHYDATRHNVGFWFVDRLAHGAGAPFRAERKFHGDIARVALGGIDCRLLKPTTFMNRSGQAIAALADFYRIDPEAILVVHDELDLAPGVARLKRGGGHGGHNGLRDTVAQLDTQQFARLRIGIGHPGERSQVTPFVLGRPDAAQQVALCAALDESERVVTELLAGDWDRAVRTLHSRT